MRRRRRRTRGKLIIEITGLLMAAVSAISWITLAALLLTGSGWDDGAVRVAVGVGLLSLLIGGGFLHDAYARMHAPIDGSHLNQFNTMSDH